MKQDTSNICQVLDCDEKIYSKKICRKHYEMNNGTLKCHRKDCTFKRHNGNKYCENCERIVSQLYDDLHKATDKCQQIVGVMNRKYDVGYNDELYLS